MSNAAVTRNTTFVGVRLPNDLVAKIDRQRGNTTRTAIIRDALLRVLTPAIRPIAHAAVEIAEDGK